MYGYVCMYVYICMDESIYDDIKFLLSFIGVFESMYVCMYVHRRFYQCQQDLSICMYSMYVQYVCMYM